MIYCPYVFYDKDLRLSESSASSKVAQYSGPLHLSAKLPVNHFAYLDKRLLCYAAGYTERLTYVLSLEKMRQAKMGRN